MAHSQPVSPRESGFLESVVRPATKRYWALSWKSSLILNNSLCTRKMRRIDAEGSDHPKLILAIFGSILIEVGENKKIKKKTRVSTNVV